MTRRAWFFLIVAALLTRLPWTRTTSRWVDKLVVLAEEEIAR